LQYVKNTNELLLQKKCVFDKTRVFDKNENTTQKAYIKDILQSWKLNSVALIPQSNALPLGHRDYVS